MKQRFSAIDVCATVTALNQRIVGLRLQNVYDVNSKTFLMKFTEPDHKELVLVESGIRLHTTDYARDKSITPTCVAAKLTAVKQIGMDRVVDFEFAVMAGAQEEGTYHIVCEFYASGNIILTDYQYRILALLRVVVLEEDKFAVGETYGLAESRDIQPVQRQDLVNLLAKAGPKDNLKRTLATFGAYGPALSEHVILRAKLSPTLRIATGMDLTPQSPQIDALMMAYGEAYGIAQELRHGVHPGYTTFLPRTDSSPEEDLFDEFHPWLFEQHKNKPYREYPSFADAADVFFSNIEAQRLKVRVQQQEIAAVKKLEAIKSEHDGRVASLELAHRKAEEQARRIELNLEFAVAAGMDWQELEELVDDQRDLGNPVAEQIKKLNLGVNQITLELDDPDDWDDSDSDGDDDEQREFAGPLDVDVDIFQSAFANAQRYYTSRRAAGVKHSKTLAVSQQALQSAEQKIRADLKATKITATVSQLRKPFWFEKFAWFVSSDGYLVIAGRDMQQNEILVKKYLKPGDAYIHADIHGAASVIVKNKIAPEAASVLDKADSSAKKTAETIPPSTLFQAGIMSVCQSRAWDAKIVTSAWWVEASQVSKTAPTGEYLTTGSFMIRGKKHFLPPTQLVYGFGFLFRLADDESVARHVKAHQQRMAIMEENRRTFEGSAAKKDEPELAPEEPAGNDDEFTIINADAPEEVPPAKQPKPARSDGIDFVAARSKYNLDEVEQAHADDFGDSGPSAAHTSSKKQISAKERRQQRKERKQGKDHEETEVPQGKLSKKEMRRLEEERKFEASQQKQKQQPQKRGKKGKMKKMKEKYAEQDDDDREIRMALLGSTGKDVEQALDNASKPAEETGISGLPVSSQAPPSIVDQFKAMATKQDSDDKPYKKPANEKQLDEDEDAADISMDQMNVLDLLTPSPLAGDNLSFAIPVCAPYNSLSAYKYRVKLVPGVMKKGKASKMALSVFLAAADNNKPKSTHSADSQEAERLEFETILANREKELMKGVSDVEMIAQMLGKVKVTAPNMESIKQKSKSMAKAKAKGKRKDD
ncbi:DUF814-domain-containing protein [Linderina pennispora]|uniref:Ribosome quality control complex subunit 2 n=1 Tax=Linderina pennispora TaxID=61395 RepID=A0A1Y1W249_9FUNG|nr:DUF814-domain-containing protein [Linderina pennispora]ORX67522.1 DUF814-domain-containing protein [Linderina pennispora]